MSIKHSPYYISPELVLGIKANERVPIADQKRQRKEVKAILTRLRRQPGVILADEVGMGKTFVALAIAYCIASRDSKGPVVVMVPPNLVEKWEQDLRTFCELYLKDRHPVCCRDASHKELIASSAVRYGTARHSIELMRLLDDPPSERCNLIFLAQGAMSRSQTDKWVRLALISEALRRHGRGRATRLIKVKKQIHRFLAELLRAIGEQRAHSWGDELWKSLLKSKPSKWKQVYNRSVSEEGKRLDDDPVPESIADALRTIDLKPLAEALKQMPLRARGDQQRLSRRLNATRAALKVVEGVLWKQLLAQAHWRSPLLIMDEAHHLKNPATALARQLQSVQSEHDLQTGDGAMAGAFDRMLFLTATPFQLGHRELVRVLQRFSDVHWDQKQLGNKEAFVARLEKLGECLDICQRAAISFQRSWQGLRHEDCGENMEEWWIHLRKLPRADLTNHQCTVIENFEETRRRRVAAEKVLRPWIIRHNKGKRWAGTAIKRRERIDGAAIVGNGQATGLPIPAEQLLPFFLAARSTVNSGKDLLGEALCSSYEAFRNTRQNNVTERDDQDAEPDRPDFTHATWYLQQFDASFGRLTGKIHPKMAATVTKTVDLWESGEKVLVFAFYRQTCAALRVYISEEIRRRSMVIAQERLAGNRRSMQGADVNQILARVQDRYFDTLEAPGRKALDSALQTIVDKRRDEILASCVLPTQQSRIVDIMRRFLRVPTTLVRCFPLASYQELKPSTVVRRMLDNVDSSGLTWRAKFEAFVSFLIDHCSDTERVDYLEAVSAIRTGGIRVDSDVFTEDDECRGSVVTLANVQVATGSTRRDTRSRLMRAFNTPFYPDVLVCSQVMGEGVDLQRHCRHVIHHDLTWNPSTIEQRTGRIDRLGCKAEGRIPISVYRPYLAGAADDRQYRVMTEREQWFRVVMGQDEVARLIMPGSTVAAPLPQSIADDLAFHLELGVKPRPLLRSRGPKL